MPEHARLVLWDVDGTLVDAGGLSRHLYGVVFRQLFGRPLEQVAPMAGRTDLAIILDTLAGAGVPDPAAHVRLFARSLAAQAPSFGAAARRRGHALPGAAAALRALRTAAVQSVLTGNMRPLAEAKLGALGLDGYLDLDVGAYGDMHQVRAELVEIARGNAAKAYGTAFPGGMTVLVGDTPLDVEAAHAAGARVVGVATGSASQDDLAAAGAHAVLRDLTDTPAVVAAVLGP